jgi:hypothetical protein
VSSMRARCEPRHRCGPPPKPQCRWTFPSIITSLVEVSSPPSRLRGPRHAARQANAVIIDDSHSRGPVGGVRSR